MAFYRVVNNHGMNYINNGMKYQRVFSHPPSLSGPDQKSTRSEPRSRSHHFVPIILVCHILNQVSIYLKLTTIFIVEGRMKLTLVYSLDRFLTQRNGVVQTLQLYCYWNSAPVSKLSMEVIFSILKNEQSDYI